MRWNEPERRAGARAVAIQRVVAVPVLFTACLFEPDTIVAVLIPFAAMMLVYEVVGLIVLFGPRWQETRLPWLLAVDCVAVAATVAISGGRDSDVRFAVPILILATAVALPRTVLVRLGLLMIALSAVPVLLMSGESPLAPFFLLDAFGLLLAVNVADVAAKSAEALQRVADERRSLLAGAMTAEQRTRRRLAQSIHDDALQRLLASRQDLEEAAAGAAQSLPLGLVGVDRAIESLRESIHELHSASLTGPLPQALRVLVERTARDTGRTTRARIDAESTRHDELLYGVARVLVDEALASDDTAEIEVGLWREGAEVVLEVADDRPLSGVGPAATSLGTATAAERVAAAGGRLVRVADAGSTGFRAHLPV